ncbi:hypothetical protein [Streptomyces sp. GC420]|nr:hypothetical protein [Streptomyces sp. GC420]
MPDSPGAVYGRVGKEIAARADRLWDLALALRADPETAFRT